MPPRAAHCLLSYWDSLDTAANELDAAEDLELGDFFRDVFAPCGDSIPQVKTIVFLNVKNKQIDTK